MYVHLYRGGIQSEVQRGEGICNIPIEKGGGGRNVRGDRVMCGDV